MSPLVTLGLTLLISVLASRRRQRSILGHSWQISVPAVHTELHSSARRAAGLAGLMSGICRSHHSLAVFHSTFHLRLSTKWVFPVRCQHVFSFKCRSRKFNNRENFDNSLKNTGLTLQACNWVIILNMWLGLLSFISNLPWAKQHCDVSRSCINFQKGRVVSCLSLKVWNPK